MQGAQSASVLYAPRYTEAQLKQAAAHKTRTENFSARAVSPSIAPAPPEPVEPNQPPIPNTMLLQAWAMLGVKLPAGEITLNQIKRTVCGYFGISKLEIDSSRRASNVVEPRQIAFWLCKDLTSRSYPEIGFHFGGKDHTTVLYTVRKIEAKRKVDTDLQRTIDLLKEKIRAETGGGND